MFHSGDNKVLQTDREKEKEKSRQLLWEAKRAKESLRERCVPGGLRLHGRPARSAAAQRARPGAVRGGNGGAATAPEPGCRLSEVRGRKSPSRRGCGLSPRRPRLPFLFLEPRLEGTEGEEPPP